MGCRWGLSTGECGVGDAVSAAPLVQLVANLLGLVMAVHGEVACLGDVREELTAVLHAAFGDAGWQPAPGRERGGREGGREEVDSDASWWGAASCERCEQYNLIADCGRI